MLFGTVTRSRAGRPKNRGSQPSRGKGRRPALWTTRLPIKGAGREYLEGEATRASAQLLTPPSPHQISVRAVNVRSCSTTPSGAFEACSGPTAPSHYGRTRLGMRQ